MCAALTGSPEQALHRMSTLPDLEWTPADSELVVEALPENADPKRRVLSAFEARVQPETVLASNTSALSIDVPLVGAGRETGGS